MFLPKHRVIRPQRWVILPKYWMRLPKHLMILPRRWVIRPQRWVILPKRLALLPKHRVILLQRWMILPRRFNKNRQRMAKIIRAWEISCLASSNGTLRQNTVAQKMNIQSNKLYRSFKDTDTPMNFMKNVLILTQKIL